MVVEPAFDHPQGELRRIGLEPLHVTQAIPVIRVAEEAFQVPLQLLDLLLEPRIVLREDDLVEVGVPLVVLRLLAAEAIDLLAQRIVANPVQDSSQRLHGKRLEVRHVQAEGRVVIRKRRAAREIQRIEVGGARDVELHGANRDRVHDRPPGTRGIASMPTRRACRQGAAREPGLS